MTDDVYAQASEALIAAVEVELGPWIERRVLALAPNQTNGAARAARLAADEVGDLLATLLGADIDAQRSTPLQVVRRSTRFATEVLREAGVPPVHRDRWQREAEPDDLYDLSPATWADLGPASGEAGLIWGAAKAMAHLARHRPAE